MSNTTFFVLFQPLLDEFMLRPIYSYAYKFNVLTVKWAYVIYNVPNRF